jgi:hypothetical protein
MDTPFIPCHFPSVCFRIRLPGRRLWRWKQSLVVIVTVYLTGWHFMGISPPYCAASVQALGFNSVSV